MEIVLEAQEPVFVLQDLQDQIAAFVRYFCLLLLNCVAVCPSNCNSRGSCIVSHNAPACNCSTGWTGSACESALCTSYKNCSGNGNCTSPQVCSCVPGWFLPDCATGIL